MDRKIIWPRLQALGVPGTFEDFMKTQLELFVQKTQEYIVPPIKPRTEDTPFLQLVVDHMGLTHLSPTRIREIAEEGWQYDLNIAKNYPGTVEMLTWIRNQGITLAVVSNWYQADIEAIMQRTGIRHLFDFVMTSETAGTLKSDLKPFQLTLDALDVKPANVFHVGDSLTQDGACRRLGIPFVYCTWYQREHPDEPLPPASPNQFDFQVSSHQDLIELISALHE